VIVNEKIRREKVESVPTFLLFARTNSPSGERALRRLVSGMCSYSLGPVYEFVCDSFTTGNLNCFRVK
jgi:hypothetical protein